MNPTMVGPWMLSSQNMDFIMVEPRMLSSCKNVIPALCTHLQDSCTPKPFWQKRGKDCMVAELPAQTPFLWVLVRGTAPGLGPRAIETIKASRAIILFLACSCSSLCLQSSFSCVSPQREAAPELPVGGLGFGSSFVDQCVRDWSGSFYQCLWADSGGEPLVDSCWQWLHCWKWEEKGGMSGATTPPAQPAQRSQPVGQQPGASGSSGRLGWARP